MGARALLVLERGELKQRGVDAALVRGVQAGVCIEDRSVDGIDRLLHALAPEAQLVAVAQLDRLVRARGGAGRNGGPAHRAIFQHDVHLDRGIAPAVEDLAADDVDYGGHDGTL